MKLKATGCAKNKMAISEAGRSTERTVWEEGCDLTAGSAEQGAAAPRKLQNLSAYGEAQQQHAEANTEH